MTLSFYRCVLAVVVMRLKERVHQAAIIEIRTESLKQLANRPLDSFAVIARFPILTSPSSISHGPRKHGVSGVHSERIFVYPAIGRAKLMSAHLREKNSLNEPHSPLGGFY